MDAAEYLLLAKARLTAHTTADTEGRTVRNGLHLQMLVSEVYRKGITALSIIIADNRIKTMNCLNLLCAHSKASMIYPSSNENGTSYLCTSTSFCPTNMSACVSPCDARREVQPAPWSHGSFSIVSSTGERGQMPRSNELATSRISPLLLRKSLLQGTVYHRQAPLRVTKTDDRMHGEESRRFWLHGQQGLPCLLAVFPTSLGALHAPRVNMKTWEHVGGRNGTSIGRAIAVATHARPPRYVRTPDTFLHQPNVSGFPLTFVVLRFVHRSCPSEWAKVVHIRLIQ